MSQIDTTRASAALKVLYAGQKLQNLTYRDRPFFAMVAKMEGFFGRNYPLPIQYVNPQGRSADIATAISNKTGSKFKEFTLTRNHDYAIASIQNEALQASASDKGAYISLLENEIDASFMSISDTISLDLFKSGSGSRGQVSATQTLSSTTVQLANIEDIVNIEVGMNLVFSATDGGGSVRAGTFWVVAVDRDAGTFQGSATETGAATALNTLVATIAVSDYIFVAGDYDQKLKGLGAWLPATAPTSGDNFFGVDRSEDVTRLAGIRFDARAYTIEEGIQKHLSRLGREGAAPNWYFLQHEKWNDLNISLGSKVMYQDYNLTPNIGFRAIRVQGPKSIVDVFSDKHCPRPYGYAITSETVKLYSLNRAPMLLDQDGNRILREATADAYQARVGYYAQLGINAPGRNGVAILE